MGNTVQTSFFCSYCRFDKQDQYGGCARCFAAWRMRERSIKRLSKQERVDEIIRWRKADLPLQAVNDRIREFIGHRVNPELIVADLRHVLSLIKNS